MKGSLSDTGFSELLQVIDSQRKSTVLEMTPARGGRTVKLFFKAGRLLKIEETRRERKNLLGQMLLRAGRITEGELADAIKRHQKTLRRLGDVLVESGVLTSATIQEFVDLQAREVLQSLFEWSEGDFALAPLPDKQSPVITPVSAEHVLIEGFTLLDEWPVIRSRINNYSVVYRATRSAPTGQGQSALSHNAVSVLALVDAHLDVNQIIDRSGIGEFESCKALAALLTHGYIVPVEVRAAVDDPSGRQTRGWLGTIGIVCLNLLYLSAFAMGVYWLVILNTDIRHDETPEPVSAAGRIEAAVLPIEWNVRRNRLERALEVYRFDTGKYPSQLEELLGSGYISSDYEPSVDLAPIDYVTIGNDFELR